MNFRKLKNTWTSLFVLFVGLILTILVTFYTKSILEENIKLDFNLICQDFATKIESRLKSHALLLRSGAALFASSDTVTNEEFRKFQEREKLDKNLPGILGVGYSVIIPKHELDNHTNFIRKKGFPDYKVWPEGERELYTSIIYLEPFSGRNLRAFGYDMFTEKNRRKAMEISRDSDYAMLSDKITLVQETDKEIQAGTLMYVPVYKNGANINSVEERREAIKGWVYSPYRMTDLMNGILGNSDLRNQNRIRLQIYDNDVISTESELYDSQKNDSLNNFQSNLQEKIPIVFNTKVWTLVFSQNNQSLSLTHGRIFIILISGIVISLLLFVLTLALINSRLRSKQIQLLNIQLEKEIDDKDMFISILAHDLRNPLNLVLGFSDLLIKNIHEYDIAKIEMQVNMINESANKTYRLLEDTLLWVRAQSGKIPFEPKTLNFSIICYEIIEEMKMIAENKNISLSYLNNEVNNVNADYNMVKTIIRNLISNSLKFTKSGGHIKISAKQDTNYTTITISDSGIGMSKDTLSKLFNVAQIQSTKGTANEKGSGLGLLICKNFVEKHGGSIWVESELEKGSNFNFTLKV